MTENNFDLKLGENTTEIGDHVIHCVSERTLNTVFIKVVNKNVIIPPSSEIIIDAKVNKRLPDK